MTLKQLLWIISFATGCLWLAWGWVLITIDPFLTNGVGFALFYLTLYLALTGSLALAGFSFRKARLHQHPHFHLISISFRQSIILSTMLIALLMLQGTNLLSWWNMLLLLAFAIIAETVILLRQRKSSTEIAFTVSQVQTYIPADPLFTKKTIE